MGQTFGRTYARIVSHYKFFCTEDQPTIVAYLLTR